MAFAQASFRMSFPLCLVLLVILCVSCTGSYVDESSSVQLVHAGVNTFAGYSVDGELLWVADETSLQSQSLSCQYNSVGREFFVSAALPVGGKSPLHGSYRSKCDVGIEIHSANNEQVDVLCSIHAHLVRHEDIPSGVEYSFSSKHVYVGFDVKTGRVKFKTATQPDYALYPGVVWVHSKVFLVHLSDEYGEIMNHACWSLPKVRFMPIPDYITSFTENDGAIEVLLSPICAEVAMMDQDKTIGVQLQCRNIINSVTMLSLTTVMNTVERATVSTRASWMQEDHGCSLELDLLQQQRKIPYNLYLCSSDHCHLLSPKISWRQKVFRQDGPPPCIQGFSTFASTQLYTLSANVKTASQQLVSRLQAVGLPDGNSGGSGGTGAELSLVPMLDHDNRTVNHVVNQMLPTPNTSILHTWALELGSNICEACVPWTNNSNSVITRAPFSYSRNIRTTDIAMGTAQTNYKDSRQYTCVEYEQRYLNAPRLCLNTSLNIRQHSMDGNPLILFEAQDTLVYVLDPQNPVEDEFRRIHTAFCECLCRCASVCGAELTCSSSCAQDCSRTRELVKVVFLHERSRITTESVYVMARRVFEEFAAVHRAREYPSGNMLLELEQVLETFFHDEGQNFMRGTIQNDYVLLFVILTACFVVYRLRTSILSYQVVAYKVTVSVTEVIHRHPVKRQVVCHGVLDHVDVVTKVISKDAQSTRRAENEVSVLWLLRESRGICRQITSQEDNNNIYLVFQRSKENLSQYFGVHRPCVCVKQAAERAFNAQIVYGVMSKVQERMSTRTPSLLTRSTDQTLLQCLSEQCSLVHVFVDPVSLRPVEFAQKPGKQEKLGREWRNRQKSRFLSDKTKKQEAIDRISRRQGSQQLLIDRKQAKGQVQKRVESLNMDVRDGVGQWLALTQPTRPGSEDLGALRTLMLDIAYGQAVQHVQLQGTHNSLSPSHVLVSTTAAQPSAAVCGFSEAVFSASVAQKLYTHSAETTAGTVGQDTGSMNVLALSNDDMYCFAPEFLLSIVRHNVYKLQSMAVQHGPTSHQTVPTHVSAPKKTQSSDVYSLGVLQFFILTQGCFPFEPQPAVHVTTPYSSFSQFLALYLQQLIEVISSRTISTKEQQNVKFPKHEVVLFEHQFHQCTHALPVQRVSIKGVQNHPFFWSDTKRAKFLVSVSNLTQIQWSSPYYTFLVDTLERLSASTVSIGWLDGVPIGTLQQLCLGRSYRQESLVDVLRLFRNKEGHYRELTPEEATILGLTTESRMSFFLVRIPHLQLHVYLATSTVVEFVLGEQKDRYVDCDLKQFPVRQDDVKLRVRKRIRGKGGKPKAVEGEEGINSKSDTSMANDTNPISDGTNDTTFIPPTEQVIDDSVQENCTSTSAITRVNARNIPTSTMHLYSPHFHIKDNPINYTNIADLVHPRVAPNSRVSATAFQPLLLLQKNSLEITVHDEELARFYSGLTSFNLNMLHTNAEDLI